MVPEEVGEKDDGHQPQVQFLHKPSFYFRIHDPSVVVQRRHIHIDVFEMDFFVRVRRWGTSRLGVGHDYEQLRSPFGNRKNLKVRN